MVTWKAWMAKGKHSIWMRYNDTHSLYPLSDTSGDFQGCYIFSLQFIVVGRQIFYMERLDCKRRLLIR